MGSADGRPSPPTLCREEDLMRHRSLVLILSLVTLTACATLVGEARVVKPRPARRVVVVQPG